MKESKPSVKVTVLCGKERDYWINPLLHMRVIEAFIDGMQSYRPIATGITCGVRPVERARNRAVEEFLCTSGQWLIQIDNDTIPSEHFLRLLDQTEAESKLIFGIPCPMLVNDFLDLNKEKLLWNVGNRAQDDDFNSNFFVTLPKGWNKADFIGGGFLAIHRRVLEKIKGDWFNLIPTITSEDFSFCQRARDAGFSVWFNGDSQCDHIHSTNLTQMMQSNG
jgi:GT2 family glycosyltransferase